MLSFESSDPDFSANLEKFLVNILSESGVWNRWQGSDGFRSLENVEQDGRKSLIRGEIWEISKQTLSLFCLDITHPPKNGAVFEWCLFFDPINYKARIDTYKLPESLSWQVEVKGCAHVNADGSFELTEMTEIRKSSDLSKNPSN